MTAFIGLFNIPIGGTSYQKKEYWGGGKKKNIEFLKTPDNTQRRNKVHNKVTISTSKENFKVTFQNF